MRPGFGALVLEASAFAVVAVAGLVLNLLKRMPAEGDIADAGDWRVEVLDTDLGGRRVDKVLFSRREA